MGVLPTDPNFKALSEEMIYFLYYELKKKEDRYFDRLAKLLGVYFTSEEWFGTGLQDPNKPKPEKLFIPLALTIQPELKKFIDKTIAHPKNNSNEDGKFNMNRLSKEEFVNMIEQGQKIIGDLQALEGRSRSQPKEDN